MERSDSVVSKYSRKEIADGFGQYAKLVTAEPEGFCSGRVVHGRDIRSR